MFYRKEKNNNSHRHSNNRVEATKRSIVHIIIPSLSKSNAHFPYACIRHTRSIRPPRINFTQMNHPCRPFELHRWLVRPSTSVRQPNVAPITPAGQSHRKKKSFHQLRVPSHYRRSMRETQYDDTSWCGGICAPHTTATAHSSTVSNALQPVRVIVGVFRYTARLSQCRSIKREMVQSLIGWI